MTVTRGAALAAFLLAAVQAVAQDRAALMQAHRGGVLHLSALQAAGTIDPMINYESQTWQLFAFTQDQLVTFRKASGVPGTELVPDLAQSMPSIEDGGRTYVFTLRRGIRFSTGAEVGVADVIASFQRIFKVLGPNSGSWYAAIVGADACLKVPAACTLAGGIEGDPATGVIKIHLTHPDSEFLQQIALPFASILPADTPAHDLGTVPPAATGPYMITSYDPTHAMQFVRNPYFHEWSEAAQPDGYVDRIDYRFGLQDESEVTEVESGAIDWMYDEKPLDRLDEIGRRYTAQAHIDPLLAYYFVFMRVTLPPFDNLLARQAVAWAINRRALVNLYGGPALATPICQLLPRGMPGYSPYCPYTKNPDQAWSAPDLAHARALVRQSGTEGAEVTLVTSDKEVERSMGVYLQSVLSDIGYKASVHTVSFDIRDTYLQNSSNRVQIGLTDWYQDYPAASDFLQVLLSCNSIHLGSDASINFSEFCDHDLDAEMDHALALEGSDEKAADGLWADVDRKMTDQVPQATLFQVNYLDFVSKRYGNFLFHPLFHTMFSQAWVH
jgi:peptide/nickel transport system substrate-binding protein